MPLDLGDEPRGIVAKPRAADGVEGVATSEVRVGERHADGLGADIEAEQPLAARGSSA